MRFRAIWVVHSAVGWAVTPRTRARCGVFDDRENVVGGAGERGRREEVARQDRVRLIAEEAGPGLVVALWRGFDPVLLEDLPHGGSSDRDAEDGEFTVDSSRC